MNSQTFRFQLGQFSCLSILDCTSSYPAELFFSNVPRERLEILLREYNQDSQQIEIPYICLFIQADHKRVLIDTGIGVEGFGSARGNLLQHLRAENIEPDDIDAVILSHGHGDHIGGIVDPEGRVVFRNARYVMHKAEWAYWDGQPTLEELPISRDFKEGILDFARRNLSPIRDQVDLVDDNIRSFDKFARSLDQTPACQYGTGREWPGALSVRGCGGQFPLPLSGCPGKSNRKCRRDRAERPRE